MERAKIRPERVLVVTNMWPTATDPSFGVFVAEQVEAVRRQGRLVDVLCAHGRDATWNYLRAVARLRRLLAVHDYQLIHAHYVLSGLAAWLAQAGRRRTAPLVMTHHGIEIFEGWQAPLAAFISRRAARTIVISQAMAGRLGMPSSKIAVVPCGVNLDRFAPGDKRAARAELGLPLDRPLVAWVGADRPEKRLALAREAVAALRAMEATRRTDVEGGEASSVVDVPTCELMVVSDVPHGRVPLYLQAADALLVTSRVEGGPLVVKEALACDCPVVSTDVGDVREVLAGLPACAVVPVDEATPARLALELRSTLDGPKAELWPAAWRYDADAIAQSIIGIYDQVAEVSAHKNSRSGG